MHGYHSQAVAVSAISMILLVATGGAGLASPAVVTVFEQKGDANYHIPNLVVANDGTVLASVRNVGSRRGTTSPSAISCSAEASIAAEPGCRCRPFAARREPSSTWARPASTAPRARSC